MFSPDGTLISASPAPPQRGREESKEIKEITPKNNNIFPIHEGFFVVVVIGVWQLHNHVEITSAVGKIFSTRSDTRLCYCKFESVKSIKYKM